MEQEEVVERAAAGRSTLGPDAGETDDLGEWVVVVPTAPPAGTGPGAEAASRAELAARVGELERRLRSAETERGLSGRLAALERRGGAGSDALERQGRELAALERDVGGLRDRQVRHAAAIEVLRRSLARRTRWGIALGLALAAGVAVLARSAGLF